MPVNLSSSPFALIIAGVDRTASMHTIDLSQPSTLEQRHAPITGKIELKFSSQEINDFTPDTSPTAAANWATGALITYRIANDSGTLVYHPLSGQKLFILKTPSPPDGNILSLEVGCELAYADQRTADRDVSGGVIGVDTDRDDIVRRVLKDAGITSHSIPSLLYPFPTPIQKQGGSPVQFAGELVGAVNHILYCNSAGTAIAAPIDVNATAIATLVVGRDEAKFTPVDGSVIPVVTELAVSGVVQVPDEGDYPILIITPQEEEYGVFGTSRRTVLLVGKTTLEITSENHSVEFEERGLVSAVFVGFEAVMSVTPLIPVNIKEEITTFDSSNRLSLKTTRKYQRLIDGITGAPTTPFFEIERTILDYRYDPDGYPSGIRSTVYTGVIPNSGNLATLYSLSRESTLYAPNLPYWNQIKLVETFGTNFDGVSGSELRSITCNGVTYQAYTTGNDRLPSNFVGATRTPKTANDGSTRPPAIIKSEKAKTKNKEVKATVIATLLSGVIPKQKESRIIVNWLVSDEQAYEYGTLEARLRNGRKQCRFFVGALTDELLALRPRCRINVVFFGILYRCLVDSIVYSQDLKRRSIGFMCDVISTSPATTPSTVYQVSQVIPALKAAVTFDLITEGSFAQSLDFYAITMPMVVEAQLSEDGRLDAEITFDLLVNAIFN